MSTAAALFLLASSAQASDPHWKPADPALSAYNRGVEALDAERLGQAERRLQEALAVDPDCGACAHALGVALLRQDDAEEAVELLQQLARQHPHRAEVMVSLSDAAFGSQDFALAVEAAAIALVLDATRWDALTAMVRACLRTGDLAEARRWIQSAGGAHPDDRLACLQVDMRVEEQTLESAQAAMQKCERSGDADLMAHARSRLASATGDISVITSQAVARGDRDLEHLSLAFAAFERGEHTRAASLFRRILDDNPADAEAALLLGLSEHHLGHEQRAEEALARAFEGQAWIRVGRDGTYAGVVTAGGAEVFEARLRQGVGLLIQLQVSRGELAQAAQSADRAKERLGPCAELDAGRIALLAARGEEEAASASATRALGEWPGVPMLEDAVRDLLADYPHSRSAALLDAATEAGLVEGAYWAALGLRDTGDAAGCIDRVEPAIAIADESALGPLLTLAWSCAVESDDLQRAERTRATLLAAGLEPDMDVSLNHARLRLGLGLFDECIALLDGLSPSMKEQQDYRRTLRCLALVGQGRLDAALQEQRAGTVTAEARFELALALARDERLEDAQPLLAGCCDALQAQENRDRCYRILEELQGSNPGAR